MQFCRSDAFRKLLKSGSWRDRFMHVEGRANDRQIKQLRGTGEGGGPGHKASQAVGDKGCGRQGKDSAFIIAL